MTIVTEPKNVPKTEHWAIITFDTITIPGDERSRTCPGHGYPEHTESVVRYEAFTDEVEWRMRVHLMEDTFINSKYPRERNWVAMKVKPATIKTTHTIVI